MTWKNPYVHLLPQCLATFDFRVGTPYNIKMASKMLPSDRKNNKGRNPKVQFSVAKATRSNANNSKKKSEF